MNGSLTAERSTATDQKTRLLIVVNVDWFFVSHRLPIALEALRRGYEVHLATEVTGDVVALEKLGLIVHPVPFGRGSANVLGALSVAVRLWKLVKCLRPRLVHLVTIKPVLLGGIVARMLKVPAKVSAISGMGFVFVSRGFIARLRQLPIRVLYRLALDHPNSRIIFQNSTDREQVMAMAGVPAQLARMIPGSGVDLAMFRCTQMPAGAPIVMMACRLLVDKGVYEFVNASRSLRGSGARFALVGNIDPGNPTSLSQREIDELRAEGLVEIWGHCSAMHDALSQASIFVLPSYYREGLPKVTLEAAACGRPVITTNEPGCRDAIVPGETGLLVPARDSLALAEAISRLLNDPDEARSMGRAGREWVERHHGVEQVVAAHMTIYEELLLVNL